MASSVEKELQKHLECGICLEKFEDPKVLTCQHLYCRKCLERLVTDDEITCPECKRSTEVPSGDVKGLPSNFLINKLLSIRGSDQSNVSKPCEKHDGEILKLFCQDCDQLICRDCIIIHHRDHKYTFVKDIFPAVKEEILEVVQKSRENINALESNIETLKQQEDNMHKNSVEVNRELDSFIDKRIALLERKRKNIKHDLQKSVTAQKKIIDAQMESFQTSLDFLKSSVEFTEEALSKGSEVEILLAKKQMVKQLTDLSSAMSELKPRGRIYCILELPKSINLAAVKTIIEYDEEYELLIRSGEGWKTLSKDVPSEQLASTDFCILPKSKSSTVDQASKVQVTIARPNLYYGKPEQVPVTNQPDGSYKFSKKPEMSGNYKIEVLINGRYVYGSPFTWGVQRMVEKK